MKKVAKNMEETVAVAEVFLREILNIKRAEKGATIVGLSGDLGAGKTAFTQAVAKHLGIKNKITSPTFVLMKKYPLKSKTEIKSKNHKFLIHIDAYRLKNEKELLDLGWAEILDNDEHLVFIEWPEMVKKAIPAEAHYVVISTDENGERSFELK